MIRLPKETDSEKVIKTKKIIKDAFIEIYKLKTIDSISVKEITNKVGFNRGTFYIHYDDIYDLLREVEDEVLSEFHKVGHKIKEYNISHFDPKEPIPAMLEILKYMKSKRNYIEALLGQNGYPSFSIKCKNIMKQYIFTKLKIENEKYSDYLLEYIISGNIGVVIYWVQTGMVIPAEELALLLGKIIIKGPFNI